MWLVLCLFLAKVGSASCVDRPSDLDLLAGRSYPDVLHMALESREFVIVFHSSP